MADQVTLQIDVRGGVGSRAARKVRREGRIPAILYGHGNPEPVAIEALTFQREVKPEHYGSAVVHLLRG